jgi:hypothetical protein
MESIDELIQKLLLNGISSRVEGVESDEQEKKASEKNDTPQRFKSPEIKYDPKFKISKALSKTQCSIFEPVADLGYFGWEPSGTYKMLKKVTTSEIKKSIMLSTTPLKVLPIFTLNSQLPKAFAILPKEEFIYKYPYKQPNIVSIHVAVQHRGVKIQDIDFFFGGSVLNMLANYSTGDRDYVVALIPGTKIIMITSHKEYVQDRAAIGFQFERLVTGNQFEDEFSYEEIHHLQLMKVGGYRVLFSAESDATDEEGNPVEITTSNPDYRGTKSLYQMLSNGSSVLYQGTKHKGKLIKVEAISFSEIEESCEEKFDLNLHEKLILNFMHYLRNEFKKNRFDQDKTFTITFKGSNIELKPFNQIERIFPSKSVMKDLISQR